MELEEKNVEMRRLVRAMMTTIHGCEEGRRLWKCDCECSRLQVRQLQCMIAI